jgi:hypothetical protein
LHQNTNEDLAASTSEQSNGGSRPPSPDERPPEMNPFPRRRGRGGSIELIFSQEPLGDESEPVLVFHHIRKTGGTSLRHSIRASLAGRPVYVATPQDAGQPEYLSQLATWHIAFYDALSAVEKRQLIYAGGHTAGFLIPLLERPVRAFTMVREPVDQLLSRYFFITSRNWALADLRSDQERRQWLANAQARSVLEPHYDEVEVPDDPDHPAAETWRERLFEVVTEYYTLGVQDRFDASLAMFQREFGFGHRQSRTLRVNTNRPRDAQIDPEILDLLRRSSWLDQVLYDHAVAHLDRYFQDKPDEAQDPRRAPVFRREVRPSKAQTEVDAAGSAAGVVERLEQIRTQLGAELGAMRDELGLLRKDVRAASLLVKALERKLRARDEKSAPTEKLADPISKGKPPRDKGDQAGPPRGKSAATAKP